jgi:hypothetical protein
MMTTLAREDCRTALVRRLQLLQPETPRQWGLMSAPQMICHLSDTFRMATGEKAVSAVGGPLKQTLIKYIALYLPLPWPPGVQTRPELDMLVNGRCPGEFREDVAEVARFIESLAHRPVGASWPSHPIFGSMSRGNWLRWGYLHVDHHLRQFGC